MKILNVHVRKLDDDNPDLSYLGEYKPVAPTSDKVAYLDRETGDIYNAAPWLKTPTHTDLGNTMGRGQKRYFTFGNHLPYKASDWEHVDKADKTKVRQQYGTLFRAAVHYAIEDYKRMQDYGNGWSMIGVQLVAEVEINGTVQEINSPGCWGIESDSDERRIAEIAKDEFYHLGNVLSEMGFSKRAIDKVYKTMDFVRLTDSND